MIFIVKLTLIIGDYKIRKNYGNMIINFNGLKFVVTILAGATPLS